MYPPDPYCEFDSTEFVKMPSVRVVCKVSKGSASALTKVACKRARNANFSMGSCEPWSNVSW